MINESFSTSESDDSDFSLEPEKLPSLVAVDGPRLNDNVHDTSSQQYG